MSILPLADLPVWLTDHVVPMVGALVVLVGLLVVGRADLMRFSWQRVWAISGVCFSESIRRRVLWIIPLAIVALVAIVQLQQPNDEQDAIRQTTRFCLFAAGLVVVLSTLILACTNLPREIENRVIFTVVTKPVTRLEIVLGKVVGFARVSFTILLVMGLFTWGYLHLRAYALTHDLEHRLSANEVERISRPTSEHYVHAGLLNAKSMADAASMDIFGRPPVFGSHRRYLNADGYMLVPFVLPDDTAAFADPEGKLTNGIGAQISFRIGFDPAPPVAAQPPATQPAPVPRPAVALQVFDPNVNAILTDKEVSTTGPVPLPVGAQLVTVNVPANSISRLAHVPFIYVAFSVSGPQPMWVDDDPANPPVQIAVPAGGQLVQLRPANPRDPGSPGQLLFTGREGTYGQQTKGDPTGSGHTCVFRFRGVHANVSADGTVPIEMRVGVEKNGDTASEDVLTDMQLTVTDPATGRSARPPVIHPENNRTLYASLPADLTTTGDFDVAVQCLSRDQWVGLKPTSMSIVRADRSFGLNLTKSLAVLWLLSVLVTTISVFASTFLSWPTAVVFTLVLLFGRWGLNELGDAATAGLGRQFTQDFGMTDPAKIEAVAGSVDMLNKAFRTAASIMPDVSSFSATDDIDRGLTIPFRTLLDAVFTLVGFGLPLTVAAFVILKFKEVAP